MVRAAPVVFLAAIVTAAPPELEPNRGQSPTNHPYLARFAGGRAFLDTGRAEFQRGTQTVTFEWRGQNPANSPWRTEQPSAHKYYCNTPARELCATAVPVFRRLVRSELYPRIDWVIHSRGEDLEYDLVVHPGGDPSRIRLAVAGAAARLDSAGRLYAGAVLQWRPEAYQEIGGARRAVPVDLVPAGQSEFQFRVGAYRRDLPLVIDPVIQWAERIGGGDEDVVLGTASRNGDDIRWGTTRSASWNRVPVASGRDVFVQAGGVTTFWGGSGDEVLAGADVDGNNLHVFLTGWTNSTDAPTTDGSRYRGGANDGFVLYFRRQLLTTATLIGGPGDDRMHGVQGFVAGTGTLPEDYFLVGETDNPVWPDAAALLKVGPGGGKDAIFVRVQAGRRWMTAIGGSGDDRATRIQRELTRAGAPLKGLVLAGETDSPDFPAGGGSAAARGTDLWTAICGEEDRMVRDIRLWGGSGSESVAGVAWIPGAGFFLAGTTDSPDLPAAAGPYRGGKSDGFVAWLDETSRDPRQTSYLGGEGRDEILVMRTEGPDLLLGGATDSSDLGLPGLAAGQSIFGGLDALFVLCDARARPLAAFRSGGAGDDRVLSLEPLSLGQVILAGTTESAGWLRDLVPYPPERTGGGFVASLSFANTRLSLPDSQFAPPLLEVRVGKDLQQRLVVESVSEPGMDRILYVRSSDPSKLLIGRNDGAPGASEQLLADAGQPAWISVEALAAEGEAEIIVEGRAAGSPYGVYPQRRLPVRFGRSGLFFNPSFVSVIVGQNLQVGPITAPVLEGDQPGPSQPLRNGLRVEVDLIVSDPAGLVPLQTRFTLGSPASLFVARPGSYSVRVASSVIPSPPGQVLRIQVGDRVNVPTGRIQLAKDHYLTFEVRANPGDRLRLVSEDPEVVRVGTSLERLGGSVEHIFGATGLQLFYVAGGASGRSAFVSIEGSVRGQEFRERPEFRIAPYRAVLASAAVPSSVVLGGTLTVGVNVTILWPADPDRSWSTWPQPLSLLPEVAAAMRPRSSNPAVLEARPGPGPGNSFFGRSLGAASVELPPDATQELSGDPAAVDVVAPSYIFQPPEILVPAGATRSVSFGANRPSGTTARFRLPPNAPFQFETAQGLASELSQVLFIGTAIRVASTGSPGDRSSFTVSAEGLPEQTIPVRTIGAVVVPDRDAVRFEASRESQRFSVSFGLAGYDAGKLISPRTDNVSFSISNAGLRLRTRVDPPGICQVPAELVIPPRSAGASLDLTCPGRGAFVLGLEPGAGVDAAQTFFSIPVTVVEAAVPPLFAGRRVITSQGLQTALTIFDNQRFAGTITSGDPSKVRLSTDPKRPGVARISSADALWGEVWVQGLAAEGIVILTAQATDGRRAEIPVYLFPSAFAVRLRIDNIWQDPQQPRQVERGLTDRFLDLSVVPVAFDPETGKVIGGQQRQVQGGTDPFLLRLESTNPSVAAAETPTTVVSEAAWKADFRVVLRSTGTTELRVTPLPGFASLADGSLFLRVFEREIRFNGPPPLLSRDLQRSVALFAEGGSFVTPPDITVTSLDPEKLLVAATESSSGAASVQLPRGVSAVVLQAQSAVQPGDRPRVRIAAPGYQTTEQEVEMVPAELQAPAQIRLSPQATPLAAGLLYGPVSVRDRGRVDSTFAGGWRPGITQRLRVTSSDPSVLEVLQPQIDLTRAPSIPVRTLRPGSVELRVEAAPEIINNAAAVPVQIPPWEFPVVAPSAMRGLVSRFTVQNPSGRPMDASITVVGGVPAVLGTAPSGPDAPRLLNLSVTIPPQAQRDLFLEPGFGEGFTAELELRAADFATRRSFVGVQATVVSFTRSSLPPLNLFDGSALIDISLGNSGSELPLGSARSPLRVEVLSSNPNVISGGILEFFSGESRKALRLPLRGRGDAILTFAPISGFADLQARTLLVSVR